MTVTATTTDTASSEAPRPHVVRDGIKYVLRTGTSPDIDAIVEVIEEFFAEHLSIVLTVIGPAGREHLVYEQKFPNARQIYVELIASIIRCQPLQAPTQRRYVASSGDNRILT